MNLSTWYTWTVLAKMCHNGTGTFSVMQIHQRARFISPATIGRALDELVQAGKIARVSTGPNQPYCYTIVESPPDAGETSKLLT